MECLFILILNKWLRPRFQIPLEVAASEVSLQWIRSNTWQPNPIVLYVMVSNEEAEYSYTFQRAGTPPPPRVIMSAIIPDYSLSSLQYFSVISDTVINYIFPSFFSLPPHSHTPLPLPFKLTVSVLTYCYDMHLCVYTHLYIPKYNLLSLYNVICMFFPPHFKLQAFGVSETDVLPRKGIHVWQKPLCALQAVSCIWFWYFLNVWI